MRLKCFVPILLSAVLAINTNAQWTQQGPKLVGAGMVGQPQQGRSVSVSPDGNTAIVGGFRDNNSVGAAWIFARSSGVWTQQGPKLVGTGSVNTTAVNQGSSVSISADGNTTVVGGFNDNSGLGAVWIFTRNAGVWTQQGPKLVGTGGTGTFSGQGFSSAISSDGNTVIVGGTYDNGGIGAVWVFIRSAGVWTQQGPKLIGTGAMGFAFQGWSVSVSADGNTAIVGGGGDNANQGAAWIFIRGNGVWTQQGQKLIGTDALAGSRQGISVSISSDGNTAIVGSLAGAWVFTRSAGVWTQQGPKLVGTGALGGAQQGTSVSISSDGNTTLVGGPSDNTNQGATWVFIRTGGVWTQLGPKLVGTGGVGAPYQGSSVSISSDGNTTLVGGNGDNTLQGATWVFAKSLSLTRPQAGERWIAGEQNTIRWTGRQLGHFVSVEYSSDSGRTYTTIAPTILTDSLIWSIPPTELTTRAKIRIIDITSQTDTAVSDTFKIKGYVMTRMTADGQYDPFTFTRDQWSFGNAGTNMWPQSWWSQFNYQSGEDPFTFSSYPQEEPFESAPGPFFPDWPLFVQTFGASNCYWNTQLKIYKDKALTLWDANQWNGSCSGFALSCIQVFDNKTSFRARYPSIPNFANLSSLAINIPIRLVINELWIHWSGMQHIQFVATQYAKTPTQTISDLKKLFLSEDQDHTYLYIANNGTGGGAHAIVPFGVTDSANTSIHFIQVYDNSYPGSSNAQIRVDTSQNSNNGVWSYSLWPGWGGQGKMYLMDPASTYLSPPILPTSPSFVTSPVGASGTQSIELFPMLDASVLIRDAQGHGIGYVDSTVIEEIPGAIALIPPTGSETPPYSYLLPNGEYTLNMDQFNDSVSTLKIFVDSTIFLYKRSDALPTQTDRFVFNRGLSVHSTDPQVKKLTLKLILTELSTEERTFTIKNCSLFQSDSMHFSRVGVDTLEVRNFGAQKSYALGIRRASSALQQRFLNPLITLETNSSHFIAPTWSNFSQPLRIYVDLGNNGTIDDTLIVNNTVDVDDRESLDIPAEYHLAQNYPNPFNPTTQIEYALPVASHVKLRVYNVLGQLVATLVDEERSVGRFAVEWNGRTANGGSVGSGVYFYTMIAHAVNGGHSFTRTGKMLLLK